MLKEKPEYVVTTSEFENVKNRLVAVNSRRRGIDEKEDPNKPKLKRAPGGGTSPIDEGNEKSKDKETDPDERPTLKRRTN